jgi:hypothetical protein
MERSFGAEEGEPDRFGSVPCLASDSVLIDLIVSIVWIARTP